MLTLKATEFFATLLKTMRLFLSASTEPKLSSSAGLKKSQTQVVIPAQTNKSSSCVSALFSCSHLQLSDVVMFIWLIQVFLLQKKEIKQQQKSNLLLYKMHKTDLCFINQNNPNNRVMKCVWCKAMMLADTGHSSFSWIYEATLEQLKLVSAPGDIL